MLELTKTSRGFQLIKFRDLYDAECSLQESSLATECAIWFGCDKNAVHSVTGEELSPRMHLTQEQVAALIPHLQRFVDTGYVFDPEPCQRCGDDGWTTVDRCDMDGEYLGEEQVRCPDCQGGAS